MDPSKDPGIAIAQIFVERISFSHRQDHLQLPPTTSAIVGDIDITTEFGIGGDHDEVGLIRLAVRTKPENSPVYNVDVAVVALLARVAGRENMTVKEFFDSGAGVSLVYPFVRELVANVTLRGRFGPVWLNLVNTRAVSGGTRNDSGEATPKVQEPSAARRRPRDKK
jgi:preprotein translocase subunit SecB